MCRQTTSRRSEFAYCGRRRIETVDNCLGKLTLARRLGACKLPDILLRMDELLVHIDVFLVIKFYQYRRHVESC